MEHKDHKPLKKMPKKMPKSRKVGGKMGGQMPCKECSSKEMQEMARKKGM